MAPKPLTLSTEMAVASLATVGFGTFGEARCQADKPRTLLGPTHRPAPRSTSRPTARPASPARVLTSATVLVAGAFVDPSVRVMHGGTLLSAPEGGLSSWTDGLSLPIGLALVAVLVLVSLARRRLTAAGSAEATESDAGLAGSPGFERGRDRNLPRWLDPSVAAARFRTDPTTAARAAIETAAAISPARMPIVFTGPVDELTERLVARYDGVPLLDRPDDVLGRLQGELDGGDEVEVLERDEIWAHVRIPNGGAGWVPSMTLSAVAAATDDDDPEAPDPTQPEPAAPADEPASLEALLEAIAARRHAGQELAVGIDPPAAANVVPVPAAQKRPRSRRAKTDRPAARPR